MSSQSKKRKHREDNAGPSTKKQKKDRKHKHKHRDSEFVLVQASLVVSIPPVFASNPAQGVEEMLDSMVMRYIPSMRGVVLAHSNLRFLQSTARIQGDSPYSVCTVGFDATVWSPRVGQRLTGKVNLCSPDHVSLLVHRTFNVSIPRHQIPQTEWVFEYGPAENDPEFGAAATAARGVKLGADGEEMDVEPPVLQDDRADESGGRWVHSLTGSPLGGDSAILEFTVVGLTIANQMLSLLGSIQTDPFSPDHVAPAQDIHAPAKDLAPAADGDIDVEEDGSEPDFDIFAELGRITDRTVGTEAKRRKNEERDEKAITKGEKKKRKKDAEQGERKRKKDTNGEGGYRRGVRQQSNDEEQKSKKKKKKKQEEK